MRKISTTVGRFLILFFCLCDPTMSLAAKKIGVLSVVIGSVSIVRDSSSIKAETKSKVFEDDVIITGGKSRAQVLLLDQTAINISQNAELILDKFVFGGDDDSVSLKVSKGTFRFISGKVATKNPEKVSVETPVATIGVRGTEFIGQIDAGESVVALFNGIIEVANDSYTQQVGVPGFGVTIDPAGLISAPVKLPAEQLSALVDAVST
ncbi:FecR domain-containing protein, partial [Burkholderiales bacterium]|nr:FecR domain-containing protein [Burkholderiales bacterium]